MSIAINLSAASAVDSYDALVAELRDQLDDDGYSQTAIDSAIRKAEAHFNRVLRTPEMETAATVVVSGEYGTLPADFLEMRAARYAADPCRDLVAMSPAALYQTYRGRSGVAEAYSMEGGRLRFGAVGDATIDILYFAKIPALTSTSPTNWLLDKHPDAYISACLYYIARRDRDSDGEAQAMNELGEIVDSIQQSSASARWGSGPLVPQGIMQVRGVRA